MAAGSPVHASNLPRASMQRV